MDQNPQQLPSVGRGVTVEYPSRAARSKKMYYVVIRRMTLQNGNMSHEEIIHIKACV
jgi:hypothetical protein